MHFYQFQRKFGAKKLVTHIFENSELNPRETKHFIADLLMIIKLFIGIFQWKLFLKMQESNRAVLGENLSLEFPTRSDTNWAVQT